MRAATITRCHQCEAGTERQQIFSKPMCCLLKKGIMPFYLCECIERMAGPKFAFLLESSKVIDVVFFVSCQSEVTLPIATI